MGTRIDSLKICLKAGAILLSGLMLLPTYGQSSYNGDSSFDSPVFDQEAAQDNSDQTLQLTAVRPRTVQSHTYPNVDATQYDPQQLFPSASTNEEQAFNDIARNAMPMTPEQIMRFKQMLNVTKRAAAAPADTPPKPTLSTQIVSLSPGATPPVIRLQQGFVSSAVFVDSTGADWPIESFDLGNSRAFNIQWQPKSNTLMIQAISMYTYGNLAVKLKGLSTPVMLTLVPGQKIVDYRIDMRIQGQGPNARPMIADQLPAVAKDILLGILDGVPPHGAKALKVSGGDGEVWMSNDKMYLRTPLTVLSPSWIAMMKSPDGTYAYEMESTPTILVSRYGKPIELKIET